MTKLNYTNVNIAISIGASLSFIGTIFIIIVFLSRPSIRKDYWLLFWLSTADCFTSMSWLFTVLMSFTSPGQLHEGNPWCYIQGSALQASNVAALCWSFFIIMKILLQYFGLEIPKRIEFPLFHSIAWGFALITSLFLAFNDGGEYGNAGSGWCWIKNPRSPFRIALYYGPLWFVMFFSLVGMIAINIWKRYASPIIADSQKIVSKLSLYPIVLLICWTGATVNRIQNAIDPTNPIEGLYIWEFLFNTQQGFFNALVFAYALKQAPQGGAEKSMQEITVPLLSERIQDYWDR